MAKTKFVGKSKLFDEGDGGDGNTLNYGVSDAPLVKKNVVKGGQQW